MGKKDRILIVTDEALEAREAKERRNKQIITVVVIMLVVALLGGIVALAMNFKAIVGLFAGERKPSAETVIDFTPISSEVVGVGETESETEAVQENDTAGKNYPRIESDKKLKDYKGVVTVGDTAYELFTYREASAKSYAKAVNQLAKNLEGVAKVYDMVIPLASGITFPDNLKDQVDSTDQHKAMLAISDMMSKKVKKVDIYDSLMTHRKEYIYFRTDHHWTALGAYYAYTALCQEMGIEPEQLEELEKVEFEGFLGSFYNDTESEALKKNPDVVTAYIPKSETSMHVTPAEGDEYDWDLIYNVSNYGPSLKYSTFIASDNPFTEITNKNLTDESACVVVKESFGNAFVPFLVDHYQHIYVVDYRYWTGDFQKLVRDKKARDVILLNNLSMIRNQYLVGQFQGVIK